MNYSEAVSKRVLEAIFPGAALNYRAVQSSGECDFELLYSDGTIAAIEVTAKVDQALAVTMARMRSTRKGGPVIKATACKQSWIIFPEKGADIDRIRTTADSCLAELEQCGVNNFYWVSPRSSVRDICCRLQITGGGVVISAAEPTIQISFPVGGGAVGASTATKACEEEAWKPDNRKKLGAARTAERHLVVYLDAMNGLPWTALTSFAPPSLLPHIPAEITHLWLIGHGEGPDQFVVWRAGSQEAWQEVKVIAPGVEKDIP